MFGQVYNHRHFIQQTMRVANEDDELLLFSRRNVLLKAMARVCHGDILGRMLV